MENMLFRIAQAMHDGLYPPCYVPPLLPFLM